MTKRRTIFISYRREDSAPYAGRLHDRLSAHFESDQIFIDIDNIEPGLDFVEVIENAVGSCEVLLAIIGKHWLNVTDARGQRRLDNPEDFVRLEVAAALERNIRVIPVLVNGAFMPSSVELPEALAKLARRNAIELTDSRWHHDVGRLIRVLDIILNPVDALRQQLASDQAGFRVGAEQGTAEITPTAAQSEPQTTAPQATTGKRAIIPPSSEDRYGQEVKLPVEVNDDERRFHTDARRFARLLVAEIKFYNEQKIKDGREHSDLYGRLRPQIDSARQLYEQRIHPSVTTRYDYFHHALLGALAGGNPARMGADYPGELLRK